jgi:hypothetical protein
MAKKRRGQIEGEGLATSLITVSYYLQTSYIFEKSEVAKWPGAEDTPINCFTSMKFS